MSYLFIGIFLSLIAYLVYFNVTQKETYLSDSHNTRQKDYAEKIIRGSIISSDNVELARTDVDEEGNETRVYPHAELFVHVVGYLSKGSSGLEATQNYQLLESHADPLERLKNEFKDQKNIGDNVITTINSHMQQVAYDALGDHKGAVIALEPDTGRVLVSVSKPSFNPNNIDEEWESLNADSDSGVFLNRGLQGQYPPGSTFKIVTALAYLRQNQTVDGFSFNCEGELTSGNYTLHCAGNSVHGQQDFYEAFANSCNGAFAMIGRETDTDSMKKLCESLMFNSKLPIELPYTQSKYTLSDSDSNFAKELTGIGQGNTLVSPAHMLFVTSAIANDGVLMKPMLTESIESAGGETVKRFKPEEYGRLMDASDAAKLREMMRLVVTDGTGSAFRDAPYEAYIKTGSAEYENGEKTHAWCLSFVPASGENAPSDIAVAVIVEDGRSGGSTAAPVARQVTDAYFSFLKKRSIQYPVRTNADVAPA